MWAATFVLPVLSCAQDPGTRAVPKQKPLYGRGVNLGNALEAPREGEWGVTLKAEYFAVIKQAGFDSVRIPVRWSTHAGAKRPWRIDGKFFKRVDWAIRQALSRRLWVVLTMHHYEEIFRYPREHRERFLSIWRQIAERYRDLPAELSFELLNEPHGALDADRWNRLLAEAIATVRRTNPTRKIVVGPAAWNDIGALEKLKLPGDDHNLVVTFHYYKPFRFTHQGAEWVGEESKEWIGTRWRGTDQERRAISRDLDRAVAWARRHRRPLFLGEFGAYEKADMESRVRWTRFVAEEAARRGIGFAYWEFCAGFGVYDPRRGEWRKPLLKALLPGSD